MKRLVILTATLVTFALLVITVPIANAKSNKTPGVLPPTSRVQGLTYGDWLARWWQYALTLPAPQNPLSGETGANSAVQRVGNVGLVLANSTIGVPLKLTVPVGTKLFLEVLGAECSTLEPPPFYGANEEELRAAALKFVPQELEASVDGVEVRSLSDYIVLSPLYEFTVPEDNVLGVPAGTGESVASGAYLMLAPLSPGKHTIHLHGTYPDQDYTADKTFDVIVTR